MTFERYWFGGMLGLEMGFRPSREAFARFRMMTNWQTVFKWDVLGTFSFHVDPRHLQFVVGPTWSRTKGETWSTLCLSFAIAVPVFGLAFDLIIDDYRWVKRVTE